MAEARVGVKLEVKGQRETEDAFKKVGNAAKGMETSSKSLTSTLTKLGTAFIGLVGVYKLFTFFKDAAKDAIEQSQAYTLLNASISKLGLSYDETRPKVDKFAKAMVNMGRMSTETYNAVARLVIKTKDIDEAMRMTKLASDLAASGLGDYSQNVEYLERVLMGRGQRALLQWGIRVKENATIAEQLEAIQNRVTVSTEQWADTTEGRVATMRARWQELKEDLGAFSAITLVNLSDAFVNALNISGGATKTFAEFLAEVFNIGIPVAMNNVTKVFWQAIQKWSEGLSWLSQKLPIPGQKARTEFFEKIKNYSKDMVDYTEEQNIKIVNDFDEAWEDITKGIQGLGVQVPDIFDDLENDLSKTADKIKSTFESLGKAIATQMRDSVNKITSLREEIKKLGQDTEEQVAKQEEAYKKDLVNLTRRTQDKINVIDKEIEETKKRMDKGWRDRIVELGQDKAKEIAVLERLGNRGVQVEKEVAKDELTLLTEEHQKRLTEIKEQGERERLEREKQILELEVSRTKAAIEVLAPGAIPRLVTAEMATKPWEVASSQLIFNINVEGDLTSEDALLKRLIEALNRAVTLKQFSGQ